MSRVLIGSMKKTTVATTLFIFLCTCYISDCKKKDVSFNCKFPNEACDISAECCSGKCVEAHAGTNPRCTKLSLHKPCLYTYQCEDRLKCGLKSKCCAKYWGICSHARDCCDPTHMCLEAEGFYYRRCLYSENLGCIHVQQGASKAVVMFAWLLSVRAIT